jgi:antitoxin CptB
MCALTDGTGMDEGRLGKLRFRAWRRGFREADLILGPFADRHAAGLGAEELAEFETLLDQPDHDLYAWIIGREPTPAPFDGPVLDRIKAFRFEARDARETLGA